MTSVYISNDTIQVVIGADNGKVTSIKRIVLEPIESGSMLNGAIINGAAIQKHLAEIWKTQKLSGNVHLVIDASDIHTKLVETPLLPEAKLRSFLKEEFQENEGQEAPLIDYMVLKERTEEGGGLVLAAHTERSLVGDYAALFTEQKISLESMTPGLAAAIALMKRHSAVQGKTCIVSVFDGSMMTQILFVEGDYRFSKRSRLMSDIGTEDLFQELARSLSNMIQFNKSEKTKSNITNMFFCGFHGADDAFCGRLSDTLGAAVSVLPEEPTVHMNGSAKLSDYVFAVGNLIASN